MGRFFGRFTRFAAAYIAAALATVILRLRHHVHIDPNHLGTALSLFHHKCGLLWVACVVWFWYEAFRLLYLTTRRRRAFSW